MLHIELQLNSRIINDDEIITDESGKRGFDISDGTEKVFAELPPHSHAQRFSAFDWFGFFVNTAAAIPTGLLAAYLYDLMKSKKVLHMKINGADVQGDEETILAVLKHATSGKKP